MQKLGKIKTILVLATAICFIVVSVVLTGAKTPPASKKAPKAKRIKTVPIWQITREGTDRSVIWVDHEPNPRFAIYGSGTSEDITDDIVLDKETGLVWERSPDEERRNWIWAIIHCYSRNLGNRKGWRLPTIEELSSLIDPNRSNPALPDGHPFVNLQDDWYWSATTHATYTNYAWHLYFGHGGIGSNDKDSYETYVWCVRGGQGYDAY